MKLLTTTAALLMTFGLSAGSADAADPHIDDLAFTLRNQAGRALNEARYLRHFPDVQHLNEDLYEMYRLADHIHDVAHDGCAATDLPHLRSDVDELDELFHHVEELVNAGHSPVGGRFGHGHYGHGDYHLRRLARILGEMEDTLHHLADDLAVAGQSAPVITRPVPVQGPYLPPVTRPYRPTPTYTPVWQSRNGRFSIVFGR